MALWVILGCMAFMIVADAVRGRGGIALADMTLLVFLFGLIALADLILSRFLFTGDTGWMLAAVLAGAFALDALYGLMAPDRQRRRNRKLRELMHRRKRA